MESLVTTGVETTVTTCMGLGSASLKLIRVTESENLKVTVVTSNHVSFSLGVLRKERMMFVNIQI